MTWSGAPGSGLLPVPAQMPRGPYRNEPLRRLELAGKQTDGAGLVGVIGHRNQTAQRGFGDPGDAIWTRLAALGFEGIDYDGGEDLELGRSRQAWLNAEASRPGETWSPLIVDGICGSASLRRAGARRGTVARRAGGGLALALLVLVQTEDRNSAHRTWLAGERASSGVSARKKSGEAYAAKSGLAVDPCQARNR